MLFIVIAFFDLDISQIDMKTAFFYNLINWLIYIKMQKKTETEVTKNIACKFIKMLYNLK